MSVRVPEAPVRSALQISNYTQHADYILVRKVRDQAFKCVFGHINDFSCFGFYRGLAIIFTTLLYVNNFMGISYHFH